MLMKSRLGDWFGGQLAVLGGFPAGVTCLKSITPTARISVCERVCAFPLKT